MTRKNDHARWIGVVFSRENIAWLAEQGHTTGREISRYIDDLVTGHRNNQNGDDVPGVNTPAGPPQPTHDPSSR